MKSPIIKFGLGLGLALAVSACGDKNNDENNHDHDHSNNVTNNTTASNNSTGGSNNVTNNTTTASNNGSTNTPTNNTTNNTTTPTTEDVSLSFAAMVNGAAFACDGDYTLGTMDTPATISDLKFYVSEVAMVTADGTEYPVELADDGMWQNGEVALVDFEDATGNCLNGTAQTRTTVEGVAPAGDYVGVSFTVGVPFELNHQDVAVAGAPLNLASMFWNWQGGYKFLRIDGMANGTAGWRVHLGSTGCELDASMAVTSCANPNRMRVELPTHDPATPITVDVDAVLAGVDMTPDVDDNSAICMSSPDHTPCVEVFDNLGLPFMGAGGTNPQSAFE